MTAQFRISRADVPHLEKGHSNLRQHLKTQARRQNGGSQCEHVDLENVYDCHPTSRSSSWYWLFGEFTCNQHQPQRTVKQLFDVTSKLVREETEIQGISLIDWQENPWKRTTLLTCRAVKLSTAKAYVFSNSVLCLGRISENLGSAWKEKIDRL